MLTIIRLRLGFPASGNKCLLVFVEHMQVQDTHKHTHIHTHIHTHTHTRTHTHTHTHTQHAHARTHARTHTHMRANTHTYTYTHNQPNVFHTITCLNYCNHALALQYGACSRGSTPQWRPNAISPLSTSPILPDNPKASHVL
jgi:hypothetical protein